jgi:hypothetical protein
MSTLTIVPSGGTSYTFKTYLNDSLPAGLALSSTLGTVTGTPTTPGGTTNCRFLIEDVGGGATITPAVPFEVAEVLTVASPHDAALTITATKDRVFSHALTSTGGRGTGVWTLTTGSLPTGMTLVDGVIGGTPTATNAGAACTFTVTDDDASTDATATITIVVTDALSLTLSAITFTKDVPTAFSVVADDGTEPITFSIDDGDELPEGLILTQDGIRTAVIIGTHPNGGATGDFQLNVIDANGDTDNSGLIAVTISA